MVTSAALHGKDFLCDERVACLGLSAGEAIRSVGRDPNRPSAVAASY